MDYGNVTFEEIDAQECWTEFKKTCEEMSRYVCADVADTTCKVGELIHIFDKLFFPRLLLTQLARWGLWRMPRCTLRWSSGSLKSSVVRRKWRQVTKSSTRILFQLTFSSRNHTNNFLAQTVYHLKESPVCRNMTKKNCVTLWEVDSEGKKVRLSSVILIFMFCVVAKFVLIHIFVLKLLLKVNVTLILTLACSW